MLGIDGVGEEACQWYHYGPRKKGSIEKSST